MTATNAPTFQNKLSAEQKAHEPSMDDILASIRRIIADDDALPLSRRSRPATPIEAPAPADSVPAAEDAAIAPQPVPAKIAEPRTAGADAFLGLGQRLGRNVDAAAPEPAPTPAGPTSQLPMLRLRDFMAPKPDQKLEPAKPFSLANQSPQAEPAQQSEPAPQASQAPQANQVFRAPKIPQVQPAPASEPEEPLALRPSLVEPERPADPPGASVVNLVQPASGAGEQRLKIASLSFRAPVFKPAAVQDGPAEQQPAPSPTPARSAPEPAQNISEHALLSAASGAKIGASFEALTESLLLRDPQMVERMTREMLRPMLKTWLDDNLPVVVERLVRAEIERVARGRD